MNDAPIINSDVELNSEQAVFDTANTDDKPFVNGISSCLPVSPATPVSNQISPDVKIDVDYEDQESDARNDPLPIETIDAVEEETSKDVSTVPEVGAEVHSSSPPPDTPMDTNDRNETISTPMNEVNGPNGVHVVNGINNIHADPDIIMEEHTPATTPGVSGGSFSGANSSTTHTTPNDALDDDDDKPPPAKRARVHSDADQASIAHSATPPPPSATTTIVTLVPPPPSVSAGRDLSAVPSTVGPSTLTVGQYRFCQSTVRSLKKMKDASPFLRPVDPVALNIPHYPSIIKNPMDLSTIERKLTASNPVKPDPNSLNPRYRTAEEFVADVRLIISNCVTFNGPDHVITAMAKRVEEVFDKQVKNMPTAEPLVVKKQSPPPQRAVAVALPPVPAPAPAPVKKVPPIRRPSTSMPAIRRNDAQEAVGRPKREIHPPAPKDLPYADAPKKPRKVKHAKDNGGSVEQLKYCSKILSDLHKKQYYTIANPFYEPVDWVKLEIPAYPKVIKRPMDMSTMRRKLDAHDYRTASNFWDDFKLMIRNCFTFNPAGTPVNQAGQELQRVFDEKWKNLPIEPVSEDEEEEEEDSDDERARTIAMMESQIETIRGTISQLKSKPKDKKKKAKQEKAPVPSTSKASHPKPPKQPVTSKKKGKKTVTDDDVLSFEQKKELSDTIQNLEGSKLEKVIQIIHEGVPEIRDSTEEIELEIDLLPTAVLTRLYNVVVRPMKAAPPKRNRPGKGTGTGGLKRKSMDEEVEAEKIRQLEQRMAMFDQGANGAAPPGARAHDSDRSSDSSSDDSSGSDSE
ncbi:bromodomain-containing protein [Lentinula aciculospora]|uniref:Bromodomain-containing protein n=1 Tax=Lentinula aciculospora TaxID=153920 RepID=A0A9W9A9D9_9AGAR|nr:bromodomain-containing protein [Lentinula aciculospora]